MDGGRIAARAFLAFLYLLAITRISGKRTVSQATPFDVVVSLIVGDMFDDAVWAEVSMAKFAAGVGSIFVCDAIVKILAFRYEAFFHLVHGRPTAMVRDGCELGDELRKEQLNEADVAHLLRLQGLAEWKDVHLALMERDHNASVILQPEAEPATREMRGRVKEMLAR